ncbi:2500_t:CDS:2, partial [Gigaspora rosea]
RDPFTGILYSPIVKIPKAVATGIVVFKAVVVVIGVAVFGGLSCFAVYPLVISWSSFRCLKVLHCFLHRFTVGLSLFQGESFVVGFFVIYVNLSSFHGGSFVASHFTVVFEVVSQ